MQAGRDMSKQVVTMSQNLGSVQDQSVYLQSAVSVADDTYLLASSPGALQALLNLTNFFANRYRIIFNASKTKLIVTVSQTIMNISV